MRAALPHPPDRRTGPRDVRKVSRPRVSGHRLDAGRPGRRLESPPPNHLRRERHDAVLGRRARGGPQRLEGAGDVALSRTARPSPRPPGSSCRGRTVTSIPSPAAASATSAHRRALTSLRRIPAMKRSPAITSVEATALDGDLVGLAAAAATPPAVAGGEDGGQVRRPEGARLAPTALDGGPPVAREDPGRSFPGRARLAGEPSPEASPRPPPSTRSTWLSPARGARRGSRRSGGAGRSPLVDTLRPSVTPPSRISSRGGGRAPHCPWFHDEEGHQQGRLRPTTCTLSSYLRYLLPVRTAGRLCGLFTTQAGCLCGEECRRRRAVYAGKTPEIHT